VLAPIVCMTLHMLKVRPSVDEPVTFALTEG